MIISTVTSKGQVTLPAEFREKLKIKPGTKIAFELKGDELNIKKLDGFSLDYLKSLDKMFHDWSDSGDSAYDNL